MTAADSSKREAALTEVRQALSGTDRDALLAALHAVASTADVNAPAAMAEETRASLDSQITRQEAWLTGVRREIEAGTRAENPDTKDTLSEIEHNLKEARDDLGKMADETGDDYRKTEAHLRGELAQVEAAVRRIENAGTP